MHYYLKALSEELLFIKWYKVPVGEATQPESHFIHDLKERLDTSPHPLYFLSDLRQGRITDVKILHQLGQLTRHANYGGGMAFSGDLISGIFVGVFSEFALPEKGTDVFHETIQDALAHLEAMKPGVTQVVDWAEVLEEVKRLQSKQ
jgi:hypothetical protein